MRILFISSFLLFPESRSGAAKRLFYFARTLAQDHEVSLLCLDAADESAAFCEAPQPSLPFLQIIHRRSFLDKFRDPFDVPSYLDREMAARIDQFVRASQFDVVFCAFAFALSILDVPSLSRAKNVVYLEDDLSFEVFKQRSRNASNLLRKWHASARWAQAENFYRRLIPRVRSFVCISEEEAEIVRQKFPKVEVAIVGYGIPLDEYPMLPPPPRSTVLGFIGNYIHASNIDAMRYFLAEWYPAVKVRIPGVSMHIAGKNIPADLVAGHGADSSIVWQDSVPDLRDFYAGISIFVNPIVSQRGLRTKLVEAGAFGRAIISTKLGAEGLESMRLHLADSVAQFVDAVQALQVPGALDAMAQANREVVEQLYSIEKVCSGLARCLLDSRPLSA